MGYEFIRDIHIEYPFYQRMAAILKGRKSNSKKEGREIYEVECPCCNKRKAYLYTGEERNTFMFKCFSPECSLNSLSLHELIKRFGGESMFNEWRKASWTTNYEENWFPVKNKVPYKDREPKTKRTFREQQELKSITQNIKLNSESSNLGCVNRSKKPV